MIRRSLLAIAGPFLAILALRTAAIAATPSPTELPEPLLVFDLVVTPPTPRVGDVVELTFFNHNTEGHAPGFSPCYTLVGTQGYFTGDVSETCRGHLMGTSVNTIVYDLRAITPGTAMVYLTVFYETCHAQPVPYCSFNGHATSPTYDIVIEPTEPTPTPSPTSTAATPTSTPTLIPTPTETPTPATCTGDCDGGNSVTVNEIITLVDIALRNAEPSACPDGIPSGAEVNVALILQAVNRALNGCGAA